MRLPRLEMWKRILVPHDFSGCAARALEIAGALAQRDGAELTVLHVSPLPPNLPPDAKVTAPGTAGPMAIGELLTSGAHRMLEALAVPLRARGVPVRTVARISTDGDVAEAILRHTEECDADVIVLGTHGRTGVARILLGSVAEKVIRGATVPVVTMRAHDAGPMTVPEESAAEDELAG